MKALILAVLTCVVAGLSVALQYLALRYAWGLEVVSWGWWVATSMLVLVLAFMAVFLELAKQALGD